jgi:23S rRNA G2445 N2-methylase RlmL
MELMQPRQLGDRESGIFPLLILTSKGLEGACLDEVMELAAGANGGGGNPDDSVPRIDGVEASYDGVRCRANLAGIVQLNLQLRSASRVLIRLIDGFRVKTRDDIFDVVTSLNLPDQWLDVSRTFRVDSSCRGVTWINQKYLASVHPEMAHFVI